MDLRNSFHGSQSDRNAQRTQEGTQYNQDFFRRMISSIIDSDHELNEFLDRSDQRDEEDKQEVEQDIAEDDSGCWDINGEATVGAASRFLRDSENDFSPMMVSSVASQRARCPSNNRFSPRRTPNSRIFFSQGEGSSKSSSLPHPNPEPNPVSFRKIVLNLLNKENFMPTVPSVSYIPSLPKQCSFYVPPSGYLYCGSRFKGSKRWRSQFLEVTVTIEAVDVVQCRIYGTIHTKGHSIQVKELTTYFSGEIISDKFPFITNKWDADMETDLNHWNKFSRFKEQYSTAFVSKNFDYDRLLDDNITFMRWKEDSLADDRVDQDIIGPSFGGFYYVELDDCCGEILGYYFHRRSETYQRLTLAHESRTVFEDFEFR